MKVDLHIDGLLWLINRQVFHPRGFALGHDRDTGQFHLLGDGTEPWAYASVADLKDEGRDPKNAINEDIMFGAVEAVFENAKLAGDK